MFLDFGGVRRLDPSEVLQFSPIVSATWKRQIKFHAWDRTLYFSARMSVLNVDVFTIRPLELLSVSHVLIAILLTYILSKRKNTARIVS